MTGPPTLDLPNGCVLDGWSLEDAGTHRRFSVDPDAARFFGWTVEEAESAPPTHYEEVVRRFLREWDDGSRLSLAIRPQLGGEAIGAVELRPRGEQAEVSYLVDPAHRGHGLAPLAVERLLAWAGPALGLRRAAITCHVESRASQRVAEKCGFTLVDRAGDELRYEREL